MAEVTREEIIAAAKRVTAELGRPISLAELKRLGGVTPYWLYRAFPRGGWPELKRVAGLQNHRNCNQLLSDDELLAEYHRVASELGRIPTWSWFTSRAAVCADTLQKRFGGRPGTLTRYRQWLKQRAPNSRLLRELSAELRARTPAPAASRQTVPAKQAAASEGRGPEFGAPLNFRGVLHAPLNELGVVLLFGIICRELGFIIEAVHAAYPDCQAKRCVDAKHQKWQRVRIEFEFSSSNFREHRHDPSLCDVIVCWEHDWAECPLEVVELRRVIRELEN